MRPIEEEEAHGAAVEVRAEHEGTAEVRGRFCRQVGEVQPCGVRSQKMGGGGCQQHADVGACCVRVCLCMFVCVCVCDSARVVTSQHSRFRAALVHIGAKVVLLESAARAHTHTRHT